MSKIVENLVIKLKSANYILKKLRCDNGGENVKALTELCEKHGLAIEITAPYTPQQNGIVERKFATIRDRSSATMIKAKFSEILCPIPVAQNVLTGNSTTNNL
jgi:transposase InsO family protein